MFFECRILFALLFDIEENGKCVGRSNGEGFGYFERVFKNTRVKAQLLMSMY